MNEDLIKKVLGSVMGSKFTEIEAEMQRDIAAIRVVGESGAGAVKVTLNGNGECLKTELDASLTPHDQIYVLQDLIASAITQAAHRVREERSSVESRFKMRAMQNLPFKL